MSLSHSRVLLAEDHPLMQEMIAKFLSEQFEVVEIVGRGDQVLEAVVRTQPDAIVLDVSLPRRSGLQVLPQLRQHRSSLAVVVLTTHLSELYREEAFRRGADAYILKENAAEELLPAVCSAISARSSKFHATRRMA